MGFQVPAHGRDVPRIGLQFMIIEIATRDGKVQAVVTTKHKKVSTDWLMLLMRDYTFGDLSSVTMNRK